MIRIIFEDNHLLVVEKPANLLTQRDQTGDPDLSTILKADLKLRYQKPGNVYLGLVHRLDRPVGGVMVIAKTSKAAARLSSQIREGSFQKEYLAVIHGRLDVKTGCLRNYLVKDQRNNIVSVAPSSTPRSKEAVLDYQVLEQKGGFSLVKVFLHTGRSHQIRVQLAATGHPLYGDQKYGSRIESTDVQLALHSHVLRFYHPTRLDLLQFKSFPPSQFPWVLFERIFESEN